MAGLAKAIETAYSLAGSAALQCAGSAATATGRQSVGDVGSDAKYSSRGCSDAADGWLTAKKEGKMGQTHCQEEKRSGRYENSPSTRDIRRSGTATLTAWTTPRAAAGRNALVTPEKNNAG